jgi:hypothetical protein
MRVKLVEITRHECGWKGTWYRTGQRHFVEQDPHWPKPVMQRWKALTPGVCGNISEDNCRVLTGLVSWIRCAVVAGRAALRALGEG